jgi:hypothetical protein
VSWTTPQDLKARLARLWENGDLLRALVNGEGTFPLRLPMKGPSSDDLTQRFDAARRWMSELQTISNIRIEWREVRHRVQGVQRLPQSIWVDTLEDASALLAKRRDVERFARVVDITRSKLPKLMPWVTQRPLAAIELVERWADLVSVVLWLLEHPRPRIYPRQVDIPGVHSKFIEAHRAVLAEMLDLVLPPAAIQADKIGVAQFSIRYGFLDKPSRIRFRVLDERVELLRGVPKPDVALDAESFANLSVACENVFITENETNFLTFPSMPKAIVIFGAGYGWDALARARWLSERKIHYWGDIDTHGFAILDQLRSRFDHVTSFLMDRETLMRHEAYWGEDADPIVHDLPRLDPEERMLFDDLRDNRIRKNLRLEQERVGFGWVRDGLGRLVDCSQ